MKVLLIRFLIAIVGGAAIGISLSRILSSTVWDVLLLAFAWGLLVGIVGRK